MIKKGHLDKDFVWCPPMDGKCPHKQLCELRGCVLVTPSKKSKVKVGEYTHRNWKKGRKYPHVPFTDFYGFDCIIEKSIVDTTDCISFGMTKPQFRQGPSRKTTQPWHEYRLPLTVRGISKMTLTRSQVKKLLPFLQKFAEIGELE
jgi:hypothetical protein